MIFVFSFSFLFVSFPPSLVLSRSWRFWCISDVTWRALPPHSLLFKNVGQDNTSWKASWIFRLSVSFPSSRFQSRSVTEVKKGRLDTEPLGYNLRLDLLSAVPFKTFLMLRSGVVQSDPLRSCVFLSCVFLVLYLTFSVSYFMFGDSNISRACYGVPDVYPMYRKRLRLFRLAAVQTRSTALFETYSFFPSLFFRRVTVQ